MIEAYPLYWPEYRKRTSFPQSSAFTTTFGQARDNLFHELRLLNARSIILSTNVELNRSGLPYAKSKVPFDRGVAVYFKYKDNDMCFACDKYAAVKDNIQAIRKTIKALRGIARWGTGDMMEQAFKGFQALPDFSKRTCFDVLNCHSGASLDEIKQSFRRLSKIHHPDMEGGDVEKFTEINNAFEEAKKLNNERN